MEDKKVLSFGYEDTDKSIKIELYGLVFEIKNLDNIEELKNLDKNNSNVIEAQLEKILGEGSIEKINRKRISDGYKELDLNIELNILGCIFETYAKSMTGSVIGRVTKAVDDINKDIKTNMNREQRRKYNRSNEYKEFYKRNRNFVENRNRRRY